MDEIKVGDRFLHPGLPGVWQVLEIQDPRLVLEVPDDCPRAVVLFGLNKAGYSKQFYDDVLKWERVRGQEDGA